MQVASASRAFRGRDSCGDQVGHWLRDPLATLCIVDGLGHGPDAERAAKAVVSYVGQNLDALLEDLVSGCNEAVRETRGAAMGLVLVNLEEMTLTHAGVGNTRAILLTQSRRAPTVLASTYGIIGAGYQKLRPETVFFTPGDLLFLYTDGLPELIDAAAVVTGSRQHPRELAEEILGRWALGTDDAAVLVARMESLK